MSRQLKKSRENVSRSKLTIREPSSVIKNKVSKTKNIFAKRAELEIIENGINVTPATLPAIQEFNISKSYSTAFKSNTSYAQLGAAYTSTMLLKSQLKFVTNMSTSSSSIQSNIFKIRDTIGESDEALLEFCRTDSLFRKVQGEFVDESHRFRVHHYLDLKEPEMPQKIQIKLVETQVFYLYDQVSLTVWRDTEEGEETKEENDYYLYLTQGKGRNRKTCNAESQTNISLLKTRYTDGLRTQKKHLVTSVTLWQMYDTYENVIENVPAHIEVVQPDEPNYAEYLKQLEEQLEEIVRSTSFKNSLIIMQRVLANNVYNQEQKQFRGLLPQDPFRPNIEFKYKLELLWTFKNHLTEGHPVTTSHWNPTCQDILAVGYGKFYYHDHKPGKVYIWNIKNPKQPERERYYTSPVTAVKFSVLDPNLLAVGLYDGTVNVLDISTVHMVVLFSTLPLWFGSQEPIWQFCWLAPDDYNEVDEYLMCCNNLGQIFRLTMGATEDLIPFLMMTITRLDTKTKGVVVQRACAVSNVPISRRPAAVLITKKLKNKHIYYVGTDGGAVYKCSRNHLDHHLNMFQAHEGPVTACQFSPYCSRVYLTAGADWNLHLWLEDCTEPLITLKKSMETIECAVWHPTNATILAHISGQEIYLWDILRRTYSPVATHTSPSHSRNTSVQFTRCGRNLVVTDVEGNVHVFGLKDMPFPPFYQGQILKQVIRKNLVVRADLMKRFNDVYKVEPERSP